MGIRSKILLAFLVCFGILAGVSLTLLQRSMHSSFDALERRELVTHMGRVLHGLEAVLASLSSQTRDWAEWTDMYDFVRAPAARAAWAKSNFDPQSLESADLSVVAVYDPKWRQLVKIQPKSQPVDIELTPGYLQTYQASYKAKFGGARCGIVSTTQGLLALCWARIARSDLSGDVVGTVLMGRLLNAARIAKLREQTGLTFEMRAVTQLPEGLTRWTDTLAKTTLGAPDMFAQQAENLYQLYYVLQDVTHKDVGVIEVQVPREMHSQGLQLFEQVRAQLVWTALGMALLLGWLVHALLVRRLRTFTRQLLSLSRKSAWGRRIDMRGKDELGILANQVNSMLDLIESQMKSLTTLSLTDTLTDLPNRRAFDERLAMEFARERRAGYPLALLVLDVDYFKRYNDHYGHPAGDAALQAVADVLRLASGRAADLAARTGGEEFSVLLPHTDLHGAVEMAKRIQQLLQARAIAHANSPVADCLTLSVGIAVAADDGPEALVQRADQALYNAKDQGRNCYCCDVHPPTGKP